MLMPLPARVSICLRCQLRLARQAPHPQNGALPRKPFASISRAAYDRSSRDTAEPDADRLRRQRPRYKGEKRIHPNGRIRGRPGEEVREESAKLSVDSLGKPAEVIILRETPVRIPEKPVEMIEDDEPDDEKDTRTPVSGKDILADIQKEGKKESKEAVNGRIEELRPKSDQGSRSAGMQSLSVAEHRRIIKSLKGSFTAKQLDDYMRVNEPVIRPEVYFLQDKESGLVAPWRPEMVPSTVLRLVTVSKPYRRIARRNSPERKAHQIVFDYWGISSAFENSLEEGQLEIQHMTHRDFQALSSGHVSQLRTIAEKQNVRIEVLGGNNVRITGPQEDANAALEHIKGFIQTLSLRVVELGPLITARAEAFTMLMASRKDRDRSAKIIERRKRSLQNSIAQVAADVTGIAMDVRPAGKFALNVINTQQYDDATRALVASIDILTPMSVLSAVETSEKSGKRYQEVGWRDGLPFILSARSLARLTSPVLHSRVETNEAEVFSSLAGRPKSLNKMLNWKPLGTKSLNLSIPPPSWGLWKLHTSVGIGKLLQVTPVTNVPLNKPQPEDEHTYYFHDTAPGLLGAAPYLTFDQRPRSNEILFRFLIDPSRTVARQNRSELQIAFQVGRAADGSSMVEVDSIRFIARRRAWIQPLPDRLADLQLQRDLAIDLRLDSLHDNQFETVNQFIEICKQTIITPGPIRVPASLKVRLPRRALETPRSPTAVKSDTELKTEAAREPARTINSVPESGVPSNALEEQEVDFLLAHIEHRQTRVGTFAGETMISVSRDGGRLSGKGNTLRLVKSYDAKVKADGSIEWPILDIHESQKALLTAAGRLSWLMDNVALGRGWLDQGQESRDDVSGDTTHTLARSSRDGDGIGPSSFLREYTGSERPASRAAGGFG